MIVAGLDAARDDFAQAGYLAAKVGKSDLCDSIFGQGRVRFPKDPDLYVYQGWAMLNLHRNTEAVAAFETSEQLLASGENPSSYLLAGPSRRQLGGRQKGQCGGRLRTADHCGSGKDQLGGFGCSRQGRFDQRGKTTPPGSVDRNASTTSGTRTVRDRHHECADGSPGREHGLGADQRHCRRRQSPRL